MSKFLFIFLSLFLFFPALASAHQPQIVVDARTEVVDPEISKAYYGELIGKPHIYTLTASEPFALYVNILVPDITNQEKNISVLVLKDEQELAFLNGENFEWTAFFEPFGRSNYWMGPEYKADASVGKYEFRVFSPDNIGRYSLAIGEKEAFGPKETISALRAIPNLKRNFFNESPANFILSVFGAGYVIVIFIFAFLVGFIYRAILKKFAKGKARRVHQNIGKSDRLLRLAIALGLFALAIFTTWNPILIFFSGFTLFEAIFSWCGLYAAVGKNTCPI